jgi:molybdopterin converting factor small subunit
MPTVHLPALLRPLTAGAASVETAGATLRAVIADLDRQFPGLAERIVADGAIRPDVMVAVNADEVRDLEVPVLPGGEVHILPAIAGG